MKKRPMSETHCPRANTVLRFAAGLRPHGADYEALAFARRGIDHRPCRVRSRSRVSSPRVPPDRHYVLPCTTRIVTIQPWNIGSPPNSALPTTLSRKNPPVVAPAIEFAGTKVYQRRVVVSLISTVSADGPRKQTQRPIARASRSRTKPKMQSR